MGKIAAGGDFGQAVAEATVLRNVSMPRAAFGVTSAVREYGEKLEHEAAVADKAKSHRLVTGATLDYQEAVRELGERVRTGKLSRQDADQAWRDRAAEINSKIMESVPDSQRELVHGALQDSGRAYGMRFSDVVRARLQSEVGADLNQTLENLAQVGARGAEAARTAAQAEVAIRELGPAAGLDPDSQQKTLQRFRHAQSAVAMRRMVTAARDNPQALAEAERRLGTEEFAHLSPETRAQGEQQIAARRQYLDYRADADANRARVEADRAEQDLYGRAQLEVELQGRVNPDLWMQLKPGHRAAILQRQQAEARQRRMEAEGRPVKTDWSLYLELREQALNEPEKFSKLDLKSYVDRIGGAQLEQLADLKAKKLTDALKPPKAPREAVTLSKQMDATMKALGMKKAETRGKFMSHVQSEVDDAMQAKGGKPLTFDERQQIIDRAVLEGEDPDAWLWGKKRLFELTPEQRTRFQPYAPTDAPATEVEALNEALRAQGLQPTPANRLELYRRHNEKAAAR